MRKYWLFLLLSCTSAYLYAQPILTDSLRQVLRNMPDDSNKVRKLSIATQYVPFNYPDSGIYYADSIIRLSEKLNYDYGKGVGFTGKADSYIYSGDYSKAVVYAHLSLNMSKALHYNVGIVFSLRSLAEIYRELGDHKKALEYELKARNDVLFLRDSVYDRFYDEVIPIGDYMGFGDKNLAETYLAMGMIDSALYYGNRAFTYWGDKWSVVPVVIGDIYSAKGDYLSALMYYNIKISVYRQPVDSAKNFVGKANVFKKMKLDDSSLYFAREALEISQRLGYLKGIMQASEILSQIYEKTNPQKSLNYLHLSISVKDSLYNKVRIGQVNGIAFNEELRRLDAIAAEKAARNRLKTWGLIGGLFIFFIVGMLLWRNNRHRKRSNLLLQKEKQNVEQAMEDLKMTQTQLIHSEKMASLGELTAGIAHEIQNPLNFVNNFSDVNEELLTEMKDELTKGKIEDAIVLANDAIENQKKINHHGKRADAIVKNMLQHSRISSGVKEPTDINTLADEYLRLAYHGLRAKDKSFNVTTKTDFDANIGKIRVIPQDIGRVILNLINNAFYAVDEKKRQIGDGYEPTVSISTKKEKDKVEIKVKDNGNGIPQKVLDKIFQPFFTTKPTGQGTGLGLSLSYDIVKAHGGELRVNTSEGKGSEFIIRLSV